MLRINQLKMPENHSKDDLLGKAAKLLKCDKSEIKALHIIKQSIDARKKPEIFFSYVVEVDFGSIKTELAKLKKVNNPNVSLGKVVSYTFPESGESPLFERPIIIGEGPAGLFCGYFLAKAGYRPLILERGRDVEARQKDVEHFWATGELNPESNVQFGEGGAGTFSDGKLNTLIKDKDGKGRKVLEVFVECGAPENILYENKPHIGTDILRDVVKNMRNKILEMGGEVRFESQVTDLHFKDGKVSELEINGRELLPCQVAVLAIGHSARNTFQMLYDREVPMEAKSFAVGFRVEHPQKMIDYSQYGKEKGDLPTAAYKLTAQTSLGRGVYSFCMCPGGYVVNASSEEGLLAVNGMSYSGRDGANANSAIIVSVTPKDFGSDHPLAGLQFQRRLEEKAYAAGRGKVPVQRYGEYKEAIYNKTGLNNNLPEENARQIIVPVNEVATKAAFDDKNVRDFDSLAPCIKGQFTEADLSDILPIECGQAFVEGMEQFGRTISGFADANALLSGVESRTSSPVRIHRDETGQTVISGLYPCGEGAGYAGGITSAAMDGILVAERIAKKYACPI